MPGGDDSGAYVDNGDGDNQADDNTADNSQTADQGAPADDQNAQQDAQMAADEWGESAPIPDEGQFTLVLRDGSRIQAVAFTHTNGKIIYITTDGMRRSLADSQLNSDETVRVNQERGTPLQLPL